MFSTSSSRSLSLLLVWMPTGTLDLHVDCQNYIELHNILYKNNQSLETLLVTADTNPNIQYIFAFSNFKVEFKFENTKVK